MLQQKEKEAKPKTCRLGFLLDLTLGVCTGQYGTRCLCTWCARSHFEYFSAPKIGYKKTHVWARLHHHGIVDHSDYIAVKWNSEILYLFTETENRAHREREMRLKFLFVSFEFCVVSTNSPVVNNEWWTVFDWPHAIQIESVNSLKFTSKCRWISSVLTKWTKSSHLRTGALSIDERAWVDIIIISALMVLFRTILYGHKCAWWYFRKIGDHFSLEKLSVAAIPQIHYAENFDME